MTEEQRQGRYQNVGDPIKRPRLMSAYAEGVASPYVFQGIGAFEIAFEKMEKDLKAGGPWLVGTNVTLADINMMPFVARMDFVDLLDVWISDRPAAQDGGDAYRLSPVSRHQSRTKPPTKMPPL